MMHDNVGKALNGTVDTNKSGRVDFENTPGVWDLAQAGNIYVPAYKSFKKKLDTSSKWHD